MVNLSLRHRDQQTRLVLGGGIVVVQSLQHRNGVADGRERIAQLMRQGRKEFILPTIRVTQRLRHSPVFGDVGHQRQDTLGSAINLLQQRQRFANPDGFPILSQVTVLDLQRRGFPVSQPLKRPSVGGPIGGVHELENVAADQLVLRVAQHSAKRRVCLLQPPFSIRNGDPFTRLFKNRPKTRLALSQRLFCFFCFLALRDVLQKDDDAADFAILFTPRTHLPTQPVS